jgi:hypothetical protein
MRRAIVLAKGPLIDLCDLPPRGGPGDRHRVLKRAPGHNRRN